MNSGTLSGDCWLPFFFQGTLRFWFPLSIRAPNPLGRLSNQSIHIETSALRRKFQNPPNLSYPITYSMRCFYEIPYCTLPSVPTTARTCPSCTVFYYFLLPKGNGSPPSLSPKPKIAKGSQSHPNLRAPTGRYPETPALPTPSPFLQHLFPTTHTLPCPLTIHRGSSRVHSLFFFCPRGSHTRIYPLPSSCRMPANASPPSS